MLQQNMFSSQYICNKLNISSSTLSHINLGKYKKFKYPDNISFPIQSHKIVTSNRKISIENILHLLIDYLTTNLTCKQLAKKYNISLSYAKNIIANKNNNHCLVDLQFPLKNYKNFNLQKIEKKLSILKTYS